MADQKPKKKLAEKSVTITFNLRVLLIIVLGLVILAAGFTGGVLYQKHKDTESPYTLCDCPLQPLRTSVIIRGCC